MEKNEKNEELQNRRDFFKKAAKSALPIFGKKLNEEKSNGQTRKRT